MFVKDIIIKNETLHSLLSVLSDHAFGLTGYEYSPTISYIATTRNLYPKGKI